MIRSRTEELNTTQVKYVFPIGVGDAVPVLLTAPARLPPPLQLDLPFHWDTDTAAAVESRRAAAHPEAGRCVPAPAAACWKTRGRPQCWTGQGLRGFGSATQIAWANLKTPALGLSRDTRSGCSNCSGFVTCTYRRR